MSNQWRNDVNMLISTHFDMLFGCNFVGRTINVISVYFFNAILMDGKLTQFLRGHFNVSFR